MPCRTISLATKLVRRMLVSRSSLSSPDPSKMGADDVAVEDGDLPPMFSNITVSISAVVDFPRHLAP